MPDLPEIKEDSDINISGSSQTALTDSDSSFDERNLREAYAHNLQAVNVTSKEFKSLPADIRYEILTDIKETRKQSSWGRLHELPAQSDQFSTFQMKRLLKRRQVQICLEEAEKQMEGRSLTLSELQSFLTEEGVITAKKVADSCSKQIASDENTRYLLVRDLKKAIEAAARKEIEEKQKSLQNSQESSSSSQELQVFSQEIQKIIPKIQDENNEIKNKAENNDEDEEYNTDLQKAIQMSLECSNTSMVYDDKDYECDEIKMNREQRKLLKDAAASLAKAYLIEYGGMNEDEIKEMLEQSQISQNNNLDDNNDDEFSPYSFKFNDKFILKGEISSPYRHMRIPLGKDAPSTSSSPHETTLNSVEHEDNKIQDITKSEEKKLKIFDESISDSDDSDLIEVAEKEDPSPIKYKSQELETETTKNNEKLQITIDFTQKLNTNDDIFADIFENDNKIESIEAKPTEESVEKINTNVSTTANQDKSNIESTNLHKKIEQEIDKSIKLKSYENDVVMKDNEQNKNTNEILTPAFSSKSQLSSHGKILEKLKKDIQNVEKVTLDDDIEMKSDTIETENVSNTDNPKSILDTLKKQLSEIPKISLDDIKIQENLSDTSTKIQTDNISIDQKSPEEIIEILDDDNDSINKTPSRQKAKQESISNYFETHYKIKRTPDKAKEIEDDLRNTPKVKSPFFIRKTPGSSERKRKEKSTSIFDDDDNDETPSKRGKKVSKALFENSENQDNKTVKEDDNEIKLIEDENPLQIAAKVLKDNKSKEELKSIASDIVKEKRELELERNKQDRMGTSITDKMSYECMQLLRLFGIPYIIAPMEAEAQCAFLDAVNLTDGTITDDSDIWLFGGKTVYKNFFNQQKHVMEFRVDNIENLFNVDRKKLIQLAILVGSDYTAGKKFIFIIFLLQL